MQVLPEFLLDKLDRYPDRVAVIAFRNGRWVEHTWRQLTRDVCRFSRRLVEAGIMQGDRIALISENRYEWPVVDLAIQVCGGISVPLGTQITAAQTNELIRHCKPVLIVVSDDKISSKLTTDSTCGSRPTPVWVMDNSGWFPLTSDSTASVPGEWTDDREWMREQCERNSNPDSTVTILYTSGTTGNPKGVMLSHANLVSNAHAKLATLPLSEQDVRLCWLPMAHVFSRLADLATAWIGGCVSVISRGKSGLFEEFQEFRPTYVNGVPWLYEKCCRLLESRGELEQPGALKSLLGGRPAICNCGGAPLPKHVLDVFAGQDVCLVNGYGLTEASPVLTSNSPAYNRPGSVGRAVPGVAIRISPDGTVLARGPNIMQGYYLDPQATESALQDEWLDTGDLGQIDSDGYLWLTGRKKELIITLTGRKISPIPIENRLLADPWIHQCLVVGNNRRFLVALIVPDMTQPGLSPENWPVANATVRHPSLRELLLSRIRSALSDFPHYEQIADIVIVEDPFSIDNELATAKLSLMRYKIEERFSDRIESLYASLESGAPKTGQSAGSPVD